MALAFGAMAAPICDNAKPPALMVRAEDRVEMTKGAGETIPSGDYRIKSSLSYQGYVFTDYNLYTAADNHTHVKIRNSTIDTYYGDVHWFTLKYLDNGYYSIVQSGTDMCFDVPLDSNGKEGTVVEYFEYSGKTDPSKTTINQQWSIEPTDKGYRIRSRYCSLCLDVLGGILSTYDEIGIYHQTDNINQAFTLVPKGTFTATPPIKYEDFYIRSATSKNAWLDVAGYPEYTAGTNVAIYNNNDDCFYLTAADIPGFEIL